ncbi:hypothetical protein MW871_14855 [Flavobacterium sp. I-SCBP12n]|uniref:HNH endonuclease n=1 Tax=Flavobacterium pygoscelis TaxID=2893176 RepID=A0A9X2BMK9_9FLAO|nr:hypothetical protein [Flavobacterium pygoscelis]MCK8143167.1 hypothetical protein [Flavobacterium pygoscelis]
MSDFRYHPIIEDLKINEDGTVILLKGQSINIYEHAHGKTKKGRKVVTINQKTLTTTRLTLEAWQGVKPSGEMTARRVDENGGDHYSNLYWGKTGSTASNQKDNPSHDARRKLTREIYEDINARCAKETKKSLFKEYGIDSSTYYQSKFYEKDK